MKLLRSLLRQAKSIEQDYRDTLISRKNLGMSIPDGILDAWMAAMEKVEFYKLAIQAIKKGSEDA